MNARQVIRGSISFARNFSRTKLKFNTWSTHVQRLDDIVLAWKKRAKLQLSVKTNTGFVLPHKMCAKVSIAKCTAKNSLA